MALNERPTLMKRIAMIDFIIATASFLAVGALFNYIPARFIK